MMKTIDRRDFLSRLSLATAAVTLPHRTLSFFARPQEFVEVEIMHGRIRGSRSDGVNVFKGIPYAGRVSGDRRFRRPAGLEPWSGVRDTLKLGPPAIQAPRRDEPEPAERTVCS